MQEVEAHLEETPNVKVKNTDQQKDVFDDMFQNGHEA